MPWWLLAGLVAFALFIASAAIAGMREGKREREKKRRETEEQLSTIRRGLESGVEAKTLFQWYVNIDGGQGELSTLGCELIRSSTQANAIAAMKMVAQRRQLEQDLLDEYDRIPATLSASTTLPPVCARCGLSPLAGNHDTDTCVGSCDIHTSRGHQIVRQSFVFPVCAGGSCSVQSHTGLTRP